jgi:hypothetical protein
MTSLPSRNGEYLVRGPLGQGLLPLLEGSKLRHSIKNVHREVSVAAKPLPGDKMLHHLLEFRKAVIDSSDTV